MKTRKILALLLATSLALPTAQAQQPADPRRAEARERFERGLRAFNGGDNATALAEFRRAHELVPHAQVLYNLTLVLAAAGRPVEAVEAADRLLQEPGNLSAEQLGRLRSMRGEQAARVGEISVQANVAGGVVEVDGLRVGALPLGKPLKVATGARVVTVIAPDHKPESREVVVASGAVARVSFELVPLQVSLAHLTVKTRLLAVDVLIDGQLVGRGPLPASLALAPGNHTIEARRTGYRAARQTIELGPGTTGEVSLDPEEDPGADGGFLALKNAPPEAQVFVDDRPRPAGRPVALPPGPHRLRVEAGGFRPFERVFDVPPGGSVALLVDPEPTPEAIAAHADRVRSGRRLGWGVVAGGVAVAAAGGGLLFYNASQRKKNSSALDSYDYEPASKTSGRCVYNGETHALSFCEAGIESLLDDNDRLKQRDFYGYLVLGLGAATAATGVVLLALGDDPHRYDRFRIDSPYGRRGPSLRLVAGPGALGVAGSF